MPTTTGVGPIGPGYRSHKTTGRVPNTWASVAHEFLEGFEDRSSLLPLWGSHAEARAFLIRLGNLVLIPEEEAWSASQKELLARVTHALRGLELEERIDSALERREALEAGQEEHGEARSLLRILSDVAARFLPGGAS